MARQFSVVVGINAAPAKIGAAQFAAASGQVVAGNRAMTVATARTNRGMLGLITTLGRVRGVATLAFAGFLGVGGIGAIIRTLTQFTGALSKVEALLGDRAVGGAMTALSAKARELGATTVFTATQAAEGMQFLTLAGFDALEVYQAIGPSLQLAQAGALGLGQAADIVSNIMAGFTIEASRTGEVVDALAFVASRTNTNIQQLGEAMKFVAPVAGAIGISVEETAAALGILGNAGLQASLAGTSLRRVFSGLLNPSKEAAGVLGDMGLKAGDLVEKIGKPGGLNEVIHILAERGLGAAEAFTLFGQRGAPGVLSLINQRDKLNQMNISMADIVGTAKDMATVMTDNLGGDARLAISALQEGILQLGQAGLTQWLRDTTQQFGGFIRGLTGVKINMFEATEAMKSGIGAGEKFIENLDTIKKAVVVLAAFLLRNMVAALVTTIAQVVAGTAAFIIYNGVITGTGVAANLATAGLLKMRAALISTGIGAAAVVLGFLVAKLLEVGEATDDIVSANMAAERSFADLSDAVNIAAFNFDSYVDAERRAAITDLTKLIDEQSAQWDKLRDSAEDAAAAQLLLIPANQKLKEATEALNEVYGKGFDIQTIYATAGSENAMKLIAFKDAQLEVNDIMRQFGSATLNEVLPPLERMARDIKINQERLKIWNLMLTDSKLSTEEATKAIRGIIDAKDLFAKQLKAETGLLEDEFVILQALLKKYGEFNADIDDMQNNYRILATALATMIATGNGATSSADALRIALVNVAKAMGKDAAEAAEKLAEEFQTIEDRLNPLPALTRKFEAEAKILADTIGTATTEAVARLRAELLKLRGEYDANIKKMEENCKEQDELTECMDDNAKRMEALWDQALRNIQDSFADAFKGAFDSFEDFGKSLLDAFKDLFANIAAEAAVSGILDFFGLGSGFSGFGKGAGGAGGGFNLSSLTSIFGFGGGGGAATDAAGGAGASGAGGIAAGLINPITAVAAAVIANIKLFDDGWRAATSDIDWKQLALKSIAANLFSPIAGMIGIMAAGSVMMDDLFQKLGLSDKLASILSGSSIVTRLFGRKAPEATASGLNLGFNAGEVGGNSFVDLFEKGGLFRSDRRSTQTTQLQSQDSNVMSIQESFNELLEPFQLVIEQMGGSVEDLRNFSTALTRLDLKDKTEEEIAEIISEFLADSVNSAVTQFLRTSDSLSQAVRTTALQFAGNIEEMFTALQLLANITTLQSFDVLTEAQNAYTLSQQTSTQALEHNIGVLREVLAVYDGSLSSLAALENAYVVVTQQSLQLVIALQAVGASISTMFQDSAQTIRESLLSEEELYNLRRTQIDALVEQASTETDPQELNRLAEEINRLGLDSFNLLDEGQQAALAPEFIEFFDNMDAFFGAQVSEGISDAVSAQAEIDLEVAEALAAAAEVLMEAATLQRDNAIRDRDRRVDGYRRREVQP